MSSSDPGTSQHDDTYEITEVAESVNFPSQREGNTRKKKRMTQASFLATSVELISDGIKQNNNAFTDLSNKMDQQHNDLMSVMRSLVSIMERDKNENTTVPPVNQLERLSI